MFGFVELVAAYINAIVLKSSVEEFFGLWRWSRVATESRIFTHTCVHLHTHLHIHRSKHIRVCICCSIPILLTDTYLCVDEQKHTHTGFSFDAKDDHVLELPIGIRRSPVTNLAYKGSIAVY